MQNTMCKTTTANALKLKEYIDSIADFRFVSHEPCPYIDHIGALFTDAILQAGVNYRKVVWPRVYHVLKTYPYASTVLSFAEVLLQNGTSTVLRWNNCDKIQRMDDLVSFCLNNEINTAKQLTEYLKYDINLDYLKTIHGIGNKTCDYLKRLLGFDIVAVDRHIRFFIENAGIVCRNYYDMKEVVEYAADFMDCARRDLDYSIWSYMSQKEHNAYQLHLNFE